MSGVETQHEVQVRLDRAFGPHLQALCERAARTLAACGFEGLLVYAGSPVPVMVVSAGAIAFLALSAVSIQVIHPPRNPAHPAVAGVARGARFSIGEDGAPRLAETSLDRDQATWVYNHLIAEVVRMLKGRVGPENFRKGMDLYFSRHDGEAGMMSRDVASSLLAVAAGRRGAGPAPGNQPRVGAPPPRRIRREPGSAPAARCLAVMSSRSALVAKSR